MAPGRAEETALSFARATWRAGPHHHVALELGIAAWEGLWASFEGSHPALPGLAAWVPTYRQQVWRATVASLGVDEPG